MRRIGRDEGESQDADWASTRSSRSLSPHTHVTAVEPGSASSGPSERRRVSCSFNLSAPAATVRSSATRLSSAQSAVPSTSARTQCPTPRSSPSRTCLPPTQSQSPSAHPHSEATDIGAPCFSISGGSSSRNARTRIPQERRHVRHIVPTFPMSDRVLQRLWEFAERPTRSSGGVDGQSIPPHL